MSLDIAKIRADTPGVEKVAHFNNAGASLMPTPVLDVQIEHLKLEASIGGYEAAAAAAVRCEAVYASVSKLIHADVDEVALVENATVAWDMAFYSLPFDKGDRILTSEAEYAANYIAYLHVAKRTGVVVESIPCANSGEVDTKALEDMIDDRVKLISITHIPTNGGLVNPASEIGRIAKTNNITYLLDACQSVGQLPIDVDELGCDILSATGRKYLRGPRGTGFLYVRKDLLATLEPPMIDLFAAKWVAPDQYELRPDARRFENWENNYTARLGLGAAIDYALNLGIDLTWQRILELSSSLRQKLSVIDGIKLRDIGSLQGGIVTFTLEGIDATAIKELVGSQAINVSVSNPSSTLLDATRRNLPPVVRASVHYYNDEVEVVRLVDAVRAISAKKE
ncbi:MAG: aminotransferase [Rhodospirillaceae bacterium]|nr:aminotransferase [Rhodospirillaceae bacterium]